MKLIFSLLVILFLFGCSGNVVNEIVEKPEVIKIGFMAPLTGDVATYGINALGAVRMAADEINNKGGINGMQIKIISEDGRCDPKEAVTATHKLINIDKVPAIIGGVCSAETLAAAPLAEESKTLLLSPCSSNPEITNSGDYIFRDYPADDFAARLLAKQVFDSGHRNAALLSCFKDWCAANAESFGNAFEELGGKVLIHEQFEQGEKDLRGIFTKIKDKQPDIIFFAAYTESSVAGLIQAKELGLDVPFYGGDTWDDVKIFEQAGDAAEGIQYMIPHTEVTDNFRNSFLANYGTEITVCVTQAYDWGHILGEVISQVGTDPTDIKDALYKVDYNGVSGKIKFDHNGDLKAASYDLKKVVNGAAEVIDIIG
jgi:branched-chain amino acid transport system substrate-binding protein